MAGGGGVCEGMGSVGGENHDGNGASDPSHGRRLGGGSHACAWTGRARGGWGVGRRHLRSTVWRATRPVSAAARDVAPDGPMSFWLCVSYKHKDELFIRFVKTSPSIRILIRICAAQGRRPPPAGQARAVPVYFAIFRMVKKRNQVIIHEIFTQFLQGAPRLAAWTAGR